MTRNQSPKQALRPGTRRPGSGSASQRTGGFLAAALVVSSAMALAPAADADHWYGAVSQVLKDVGLAGTECPNYPIFLSQVTGSGFARLYGSAAGWCVHYEINANPAPNAKATHYLFHTVLKTSLHDAEGGQESATNCSSSPCEGPKSGELAGNWPKDVGPTVYWTVAWSKVDVIETQSVEVSSKTQRKVDCTGPSLSDPAGATPAGTPGGPTAEPDAWPLIIAIIGVVLTAAGVFKTYCVHDITKTESQTKTTTTVTNTPLNSVQDRPIPIAPVLHVFFLGGVGDDYEGLDTWNVYEDLVLKRPFDVGYHNLSMQAVRVLPGQLGTVDKNAGKATYLSDISPVKRVDHMSGPSHRWEWNGAKAVALLASDAGGNITSRDRAKVDWEAPEPVPSITTLVCPPLCVTFAGPAGDLVVALGAAGADVLAQVADSTLPPESFQSSHALVGAEQVLAVEGDFARAVLLALLTPQATEDQWVVLGPDTYDYDAQFRFEATVKGGITSDVDADVHRVLVTFDLVPVP